VYLIGINIVLKVFNLCWKFTLNNFLKMQNPIVTFEYLWQLHIWQKCNCFIVCKYSYYNMSWKLSRSTYSNISSTLWCLANEIKSCFSFTSVFTYTIFTLFVEVKCTCFTIIVLSFVVVESTIKLWCRSLLVYSALNM